MAMSPLSFLEYDGKIRLFKEDAKLLREITGIDPSYIRTREQLKQFVQSYVSTMSDSSEDVLVKTIFLEPYLRL